MGNSRSNTNGEQYRKQISIEDMTSTINKYLLMCDDVAFAFLFGSFIRGEATIFSDVDIAIYFTGLADFHRINRLREDLTGLLGMETDIVVLNTASPIIRMQVLKKGTLLIKKEPRAYHKFFMNTVTAYDDLKRNRKEIEDQILRGRIYA